MITQARLHFSRFLFVPPLRIVLIVDVRVLPAVNRLFNRCETPIADHANKQKCHYSLISAYSLYVAINVSFVSNESAPI